MANQNQLKEKKCAACGKEFIFRDHWAYKTTYGDHIKVYCSWGCLRKAEQEKKRKKDNQ